MIFWPLMFILSLCTAKPISVVNEFVAQLQILELLDNVCEMLPSPLFLRFIFLLLYSEEDSISGHKHILVFYFC